MHLKEKLSKELKNGISILVGLAVFKALWIKTGNIYIFFDQKLKNRLDYLILMSFLSFTIICISTLKKVLIILR